MAVGHESRAKAGETGWIVLAAWHTPDPYNWRTWTIACVKAAQVGGAEGIKADTWYSLTVDGVFMEVPHAE